MGMYNHMEKSFAHGYKERSNLYRSRLAKWNSEAPIVRVDKPTNIARARKLGYKAKEGIITVRVRIKGGTKKRAAHGGGRKPSKSGRFFSRKKSTQAIAEERAARKYMNTEALNSYFVGQSGSSKYYEIILLDKANAQIQNDMQYKGIVSQRGRAFRGLTSAGRKHKQ